MARKQRPPETEAESRARVERIERDIEEFLREERDKRRSYGRFA